MRRSTRAVTAADHLYERNDGRSTPAQDWRTQTHTHNHTITVSLRFSYPKNSYTNAVNIIEPHSKQIHKFLLLLTSTASLTLLAFWSYSKCVNCVTKLIIRSDLILTFVIRSIHIFFPVSFYRCELTTVDPLTRETFVTI